MTAGRVHLLYGLVGSGKTTLARALCAEGNAVRFTLDEWMIRLYPGLPFDSAGYGRQAEVVKDLIWSVAEQILRSGTDVVLDWNSWSLARRAWAIHRAATVPAEVILHRLGASIDQANARLAERHRNARAIYVHPIDREGNEHLASIMEPPGEAEGFSIIDELPCARIGSVTGVTIQISNATADDIPDILASADALVATDAAVHDPAATNLGWATETGIAYCTSLLASPENLVLLARDADEVVGHLVGRLSGPGSVHPVRAADLESIHVYPAHRGHGVGGQLTNAFLLWAAENGAQRATVTAYAANDGAQRFYARRGFAIRSFILTLDDLPSRRR